MTDAFDMLNGSPSLLVVEDDPELLIYLGNALNPLTTDLVRAQNGREALDILSTRPVDLIVSDISMPIMDGLTFLSEIRKMNLDTPLIFLTGYGEREHILTALRLGAANLLDKPCRIPDLHSAIRGALAAKDSQNVVRKLATIGRASGEIAHELKNPLSIIYSNANLLRTAVLESRPPDSELIEGLQAIENTALRINKTIQCLTSYLRNDAQDPFEPTSVQSILDETVALCLGQFKIRGISLFQAPCPADTKIDCRPTQISEVFLNLLNNACDAIQELEDKWVRIEVKEQAEGVQITVTDSGSGIDPNLHRELFKPFISTKPKGCGTGLGLSISRRIIREHRGTISIDQECPNTRFVVLLPRSDSSSVSQAANPFGADTENGSRTTNMR